MKYAIVTGVSQGLGFDIGKFLLESGIHLIGISRTNQVALQSIANENHVNYIHYACDLSISEEVARTLSGINNVLEELDENDHVYVINNAAVIQPIKPSTSQTQEELAYHYQVNVLAPMHIMNTLLLKCSEQEIPFVGVNITSGSAKSPLYGWSAYCSAKASIDMYTKTIALEQEALQTGNKIIGFNPGVMDTKMQAEIRGTTKEEFLKVEQFIQYKHQGVLSQTESVAEVLTDIVTDEVNITNGKIYNIHDYT